MQAASPDYTEQLREIARILSSQKASFPAWFPPVIGAASGAIFGIFGAALAEPLKAFGAEWQKRHTLRRRIYVHLGYIYQEILFFEEDLKGQGDETRSPALRALLAAVDITPLEACANKDDPLFYSLKEQGAVRKLIQSIKRFQSSSFEEQKTFQRDFGMHGLNLFSTFDWFFQTRQINQRYLMRFCFKLPSQTKK